MENPRKLRRPVKSSFIVGLGALACFWTVMMALANVPHYGFKAYLMLGIVAGLLLLAAAVAYLLRRLGAALPLSLAAAALLVISGYLTFAEEGSHGDFYPVWLALAGVALVVAGLIWSCRRQDARPAEEPGPELTAPAPGTGKFAPRPGAARRRIRDLVPADFPMADANEFLAWQKAVKRSTYLTWPLALLAVGVDFLVLARWGVIPAATALFVVLFSGLAILNSFPARHLEKAGISRVDLQKACNSERLTW